MLKRLNHDINLMAYRIIIKNIIETKLIHNNQKIDIDGSSAREKSKYNKPNAIIARSKAVPKLKIPTKVRPRRIFCSSLSDDILEKLPIASKI
jgi:hypothetical protein